MLAAYIHPDRGWLESSPLAQSFLTVGQRPVSEAREQIYPHRAAESNEGFHAYPATPTERPPTTSGPFASTATATDLISGLPRNDALREAYSSSTSPEETRQIEFGTMGQAVDSAVPMMLGLMRGLVAGDDSQLEDWTLDADRGYGYRSWRIGGTTNTLAWDSTDLVEDDWAG